VNKVAAYYGRGRLLTGHKDTLHVLILRKIKPLDALPRMSPRIGVNEMM